MATTKDILDALQVAPLLKALQTAGDTIYINRLQVVLIQPKGATQSNVNLVDGSKITVNGTPAEVVQLIES
jgi:hypothetical protein